MERNSFKLEVKNFLENMGFAVSENVSGILKIFDLIVVKKLCETIVIFGVICRRDGKLRKKDVEIVKLAKKLGIIPLLAHKKGGKIHVETIISLGRKI